MPLTLPSGFSSSTKRPAMVFSARFGSASNVSGGAPMRLCLIGNKTSAGTATLDTPVFCASADDGTTLTGAGSELDLMIRAVFAQWRVPEVWICPVTESVGVAATALMLFAGTATAAGTIRVKILDEWVDVAVANTDAASTVGTNVAAAINAKTNWPVTASGTTTVTVTWKQKGLRGNDAPIDVFFRDGVTGLTVALNGGTATAVHAISKIGTSTGTAGTTADDVTNALAAMATQKFHHIAAAHVDTGNWTKIKNHVNTYSGIAERKRQRAIVACLKDVSSAITDVANENNILFQAVWHYNPRNTSGQIAAQEASARIWGDSSVAGGTAKGEQTYRGCNLNGTEMATIKVQDDPADQPLGTEIELALNGGLTPLEPSSANPGCVRIVRSVTSRCKDSAGNANYSGLDTTVPEVTHFAQDDIEARMAIDFAHKNLVPDGPRPPKHEDSVTPSFLKSYLQKWAMDMEDQGLFSNVSAHLNEFAVEIDPSNKSQAIGYVPYEVIKGFHNFAGLLDQVG
jgi:phage tail sheath gpL-like